MTKTKFGILFDNILTVDDNHVIYFTDDVKSYYLEHRCNDEEIKGDVEKMLDEFDIEDYEEIYLYFKDDIWTITYLKSGEVVTVTY